MGGRLTYNNNNSSAVHVSGPVTSVAGTKPTFRRSSGRDDVRVPGIRFNFMNHNGEMLTVDVDEPGWWELTRPSGVLVPGRRDARRRLSSATFDYHAVSAHILPRRVGNRVWMINTSRCADGFPVQNTPSRVRQRRRQTTRGAR